jgi:hypothetical protein
MKTKISLLVPLLVCSVLWPTALLRAGMSTPVTYYGNAGAGGTVANGNLVLQDNGTTVFGTFNKAPGMSFQLDLVLYIDSVAGGFSDTSQFRDNASAARTAISGFNKTLNQGSLATFAPGFRADYAIILGVNPPNNGNDLYRLNAGGDGSLQQITTVNLNPNNNLNSWSYTFSFSWASIGVYTTNAHFFNFQSTYLDSSSSRTLESFENLTGQRNFNSVTFLNYNTYGVPPVPEMTTAGLVIFGVVFAGSRFLPRKRVSPPRSQDTTAAMGVEPTGPEIKQTSPLG